MKGKNTNLTIRPKKIEFKIEFTKITLDYRVGFSIIRTIRTPELK